MSPIFHSSMPIYCNYCWFIPNSFHLSYHPTRIPSGFNLQVRIQLTESMLQPPQFLTFSIHSKSHSIQRIPVVFFKVCHDFPVSCPEFPMLFPWAFPHPSHGVMPISSISGPFTMPPPTPKRPANLSAAVDTAKRHSGEFVRGVF